MHVAITRDEPDFNRTSTRGDPTILKREAETDLLIPDGNTAVIGGIYTRNTGRQVNSVPFFGDIPVLGVLFQQHRQKQKSQLALSQKAGSRANLPSQPRAYDPSVTSTADRGELEVCSV